MWQWRDVFCSSISNCFLLSVTLVEIVQFHFSQPPHTHTTHTYTHTTHTLTHTHPTHTHTPHTLTPTPHTHHTLTHTHTHTHTTHTHTHHTQVLEPNWVLLESNLRSVHTIDDVLTAHNDFLDRSLRDCLLSDKEVLKIISRLLVVCERFTDHLREVDMTQEQHKGKMSLTQLELTKRRTKSLSGVARLPSGEVFKGGADPHKLRSRLLSRYNTFSQSYSYTLRGHNLCCERPISKTFIEVYDRSTIWCA